MVFALLGGLAGVGLAHVQEETYEARVLVSIGASWVDGENSSPYDSMQATEIFSEKMMGIVKGGWFDEKLDNAVGFDANCGVSTFEKGNLLLTCKTDSMQKAQTLSVEAFGVLDKVLADYNSTTRENYTFGHISKKALETTPANSKIISMAVLVALLLGIIWIVFWAVVRGQVWCATQVEEILERDVALFTPKNLSASNPANLYFVGISELPNSFKKSNLFLQNFSKFNVAKDFLVVVLNQANVQDIKFAKNFSKEAKVLAIKIKK